MKGQLYSYLFVLLYMGTAVATLCMDHKEISVSVNQTSLSNNDSLNNDNGQDSIEINVNLILTEQPSLKMTKQKADTVSPPPKRYGSLSVQSGNKMVLNNRLLLRTDRIGEFINRFNGGSIALKRFENKMDFTASGTLTVREGHILSLTNHAGALQDSTLRKFAKDLVEQNLYIDSRYGTNYAAITTLAYSDIAGKIFPVRLTLRQSVANQAPVWFITQVESPYLTFGDENHPYYIDHAEREIGFMGLSRHTDRSATSIVGPNFKEDKISAFLILTSKGLITYRHSEKTQFVFHLGDYSFLVEKVESFEHQRSGFLITKIMKKNVLLFENRPIL